MTQPASDTADGSPPRRKATLYCWGCDHSSPVHGDWIRRPGPRFVAYVCPDCETTLAKRPRRSRPTSVPMIVGPLAAWRRGVRASATVWRASVDAGSSSLVALLESPWRGPLATAMR